MKAGKRVPSRFFANKAGDSRVQGVVGALTMWWIGSGGLADLDKVADSCFWGDLAVNDDEGVGVKIVEKRDFPNEMIKACLADPIMTGVADAVGLCEGSGAPRHVDLCDDEEEDKVVDESDPNYDPTPVEEYVTDIVTRFVGVTLKNGPWWKKNASAVKKARDGYKAAQEVMTS